MAYCIDVFRRCPKIDLLEGDDLAYDLKHYKVKRARDLDFVNLKHKVFEELCEAEKFLEKFNKIKNSLDNKKICKSRKLPTMRMPRTYIVLALMGEKAITERHYKGRNLAHFKWKAGQEFNIQDQTFFMTVKLVKKEEISKDKFIFHFVKA